MWSVTNDIKLNVDYNENKKEVKNIFFNQINWKQLKLLDT